jgi:hypothetical protein
MREISAINAFLRVAELDEGAPTESARAAVAPKRAKSAAGQRDKSMTGPKGATGAVDAKAQLTDKRGPAAPTKAAKR